MDCKNCKYEHLIEIMRDDIKEIKCDIKNLLASVAVLKVKASVYGIFGGSLIILVMILMEYLWK